MILSAIVIIALGVFALYNTSRRASLGHSRPERWLQQNLRLAKGGGLGAVGVGFGLLIYATNPISGIFYALTSLMALLSLVVIGMPLIKLLREVETR